MSNNKTAIRGPAWLVPFRGGAALYVPIHKLVKRIVATLAAPLRTASIVLIRQGIFRVDSGCYRRPFCESRAPTAGFAGSGEKGR